LRSSVLGTPKKEFYVDLKHVKQLMNWLSVAFKNIKKEIESDRSPADP